MDKEQIVRLLQSFAEKYAIRIDPEMLGIIISKSTFRVISKGEILSSMGDDTALAGLVLSGMAKTLRVCVDRCPAGKTAADHRKRRVI